MTALSDTAVRAKDIDEVAALEAKERAEAALKDKASEVDYALAEPQLLKKLKGSTNRM